MGDSFRCAMAQGVCPIQIHDRAAVWQQGRMRTKSLLTQRPQESRTACGTATRGGLARSRRAGSAGRHGTTMHPRRRGSVIGRISESASERAY